MLDRFRRWRASRGYGVHSPLAFRLVSRVVRPERGVAYYGEELLRLSPSGAGSRMRERARLLLRFVAELQPSFVWFSPGLPELYREAVRLAGCAVRVFDGKIFPDETVNADMIVLDGYSLRKKDLTAALRPGSSLIGFDLKPSFVDNVMKTIKGGVVIDGKGSVIAVPAACSCLHSYNVSRF